MLDFLYTEIRLKYSTVLSFFLDNSYFFQVATVIVWSVAYVMIIIASFLDRKEKKLASPYFCSALNVSWEAVALIKTGGFFGYIIWLTLDVFIFFFACNSLSGRKRIIYVIGTFTSLGVFSFLFYINGHGLLFTAFFLDVIIAIDYLLHMNSISPILRIPIAVARLLGSIFAGCAYGFQFSYASAFACVSVFYNGMFLVKCIREKYNCGIIKV